MSAYAHKTADTKIPAGEAWQYMPVIRLLVRYRKLLLPNNIVKTWLHKTVSFKECSNQMRHLQPHHLGDRLQQDGCGWECSPTIPALQEWRQYQAELSYTRSCLPQNSLGPDRVINGLSCQSPRIPGSEPITPGNPHTCHIPLLKISSNSLQMVRTPTIEAI